jgi:hypothetical protein
MSHLRFFNTEDTGTLGIHPCDVFELDRINSRKAVHPPKRVKNGGALLGQQFWSIYAFGILTLGG